MSSTHTTPAAVTAISAGSHSVRSHPMPPLSHPNGDSGTQFSPTSNWNADSVTVNP
jgi:hypothetical protein